jgi:hypothetical protein
MKSITLKCLTLLVLLNTAGACSRKSTYHVRAPAEFSDIVIAARNVRLHLPDTLSCNRELRVRTDLEGRLYVQLDPNYLIGVFDSIGHMIKVIGQRGFGQGELTKILDFRVSDCEHIYVLDALTEDVSLFDLGRGWLTTFPLATKRIMTFDIYQNKMLIFRRAFEDRESPHIMITQIGSDYRSSDSAERFMNSGDESIRTHMLLSQTLSTNADGVTVFAFMAARVIHVLSADHKLSEIDLDASSFTVSRTKTLLMKYHDEKASGLLNEVFRNSRVISLGFVSSKHILVSYATGRYEETKFYSQLYCLSTGEPFSIAYQTHSPIFYIGNYAFASRSYPMEEIKDNLMAKNEITLYTFRSEH